MNNATYTVSRFTPYDAPDRIPAVTPESIEMNVVVTGGAGFIGTNLVRDLVHRDFVEAVLMIDDLFMGSEANLEGLDVDLQVGSILDADLLDRVCVGADAIVHLAARPSVPRSIEDPVASHEANASGTVSVPEAARRAGTPHLIVASSSSVYGRNPALLLQFVWAVPAGWTRLCGRHARVHRRGAGGTAAPHPRRPVDFETGLRKTVAWFRSEAVRGGGEPPPRR